MERSTFQITLRHGIWRILLDGRFFGDYRSRDHAMEGAEEARRAMAAGGRLASIIVTGE
ncbi:MAG: hypothetical protein NVV62_04480 [Terricaulis sp.]|nr:hypothetical protein [Terricaulis sp.]